MNFLGDNDCFFILHTDLTELTDFSHELFG